jgi:hypothetical protein
MIEFLTRLFKKIAPREQKKDDLYLVKITLYYFFLWYLIAWCLFYIIVKNF